MLSRLGLTFARIDMPRWAAPVQAFVSGGADAGLLDQALHDCTPDGDVGDARAGTGRILAGPAFDLGETIGFAWARSALVDWSGYFAVEEANRYLLGSDGGPRAPSVLAFRCSTLQFARCYFGMTL